MRIFSNNVQVSIKPAFCLWAGILCLLLPIRWVFAWFLTASIHEFAHLLALSLFKVQVLRISIDISGAEIEAANMDIRSECICAAAGPLSGICLIMLFRLVPELAICALFQTVCNLLPLQDFDGGRILKCILTRLFSDKKANQILHFVQIALVIIVLTIAILCLIVGLGILPLIIAILLIGKAQKHLANRRIR